MSEKLTNFADLVTSVVKFEVWDYKFDGGVYSGASDRAIVDLADVTLGVANALKDSDWLQKLGGQRQLHLSRTPRWTLSRRQNLVL